MHSGGGGGDKIESPLQNFEKLVIKIQPEKGQLPCNRSLIKNFWENTRDPIIWMFKPYASVTAKSILSSSEFCSTIYYFEFNYVRINCKEGEVSFRIKLLSTVINIV
jgi:hypothetical protein